MKNLRKSWKPIALFAVAAIVSLCYVVRLRAFTLIEQQALPAVQLVASQAAVVKVSNTSTQPVLITVEIVAGNGAILVSKSESLPAGQTFNLPYVEDGGHPTIRGVVTLDTAHVVVSSIMTFNMTNGEVMVAMPGLLLP